MFRETQNSVETYFKMPGLFRETQNSVETYFKMPGLLSPMRGFDHLPLVNKVK